MKHRNSLRSTAGRIAQFAAVLALFQAGSVCDAAPGKSVHVLFLVRHGAYGLVTRELNALGKKQASLLADRLMVMPAKFDEIVTSEMTRAEQTGDIIAAKLGMTCQRDPLLNEAHPPAFDVSGYTPKPGDEQRLEAAWTRYAQPSPDMPRVDILVCHGDVIRWFVMKALGVDTAHWNSMTIANCSLTVIVIPPNGTPELAMYNDVSHVPLDMQTWTEPKPPVWTMKR
jgi:serine/threonine-protein phosphatase PGAM5